MAVTSSSNSTSKTGSALDVAGIVSGLMEAENVPVTKLEAKISSSTVKITSLAAIKSQLSVLKSTLVDLQTPANFSTLTAKFSTSGVASAQLASTAATGTYQLEVTTLAKPTIINLSGFTDSTTPLEWFEATSLTTVVDATVFKTHTDEDNIDHYVLSLTSKSTGTSNAFSLVDDPLPLGINDETATGQVAADLEFKLNGVEFTRSSNTATDVLTGVTLNIAAVSSPISLAITNESVSARPKLDALVKAYNDLFTFYKSQTASSMDLGSRGILNSDFGVASMMRQLSSGLLLPMTNFYGEDNLGDQTDLSAMGLNFLENGYLAVDETLLSAASSTLQSRLSAGIRIGFNSESSTDLATQIGDMLISGGLIQDRIDSVQTTKTDLTNRKTALQEKLVGVQARYTAQFASLDALLFKLQGTSDSLKSALDGLTNSQKNG